MNPSLHILIIIFVSIVILLYISIYIYFIRKIRFSETRIIDIFLQKISKIPAVIEVMRPYVMDSNKSFNLMVKLHSEAIIHEYATIHNLLEHNARINDQYSFLMKLSMAIPELQKDIYFLYIRDFVMLYDSTMKSELPIFNSLIKKWNIFVKFKNYTIIWYFFPGTEMLEI